jgi:PQQ-like domain
MSTRSSFNHLEKSRFLGGLFGALLVVAQEAPAASVTDNPHVGPPTSVTIVSGSGYGANEGIDLYFDNALVKTTSANASGAFAGVSLTIPANAVPELHVIKAVGRTTKIASQNQYWVHTDWPQARSTAGHTNANAYENRLNAKTLQNAHVLWRKAVPGYPAGGTPDGELPPIVANGQVYVATGGKLTAFRVTSGAFQWTQTVGTGLTSPAAMVVPGSGGYGVFAGTNTGVSAFRDNGSPWWKKTLPGTAWRVVAVDNGFVYALQAGLNTPGRLYALKASDGSLVWSKTLNYGFADWPAVANGTLYAVSAPTYGNTLTAYNAATGGQLWSKTVTPSKDHQITSLAVASDSVYVEIAWLDVSYDQKESGTYAFSAANGSKRWYHPAVAFLGQGIAAVGGGYVYEALWPCTKICSQFNSLLNAKTGVEVGVLAGRGIGDSRYGLENLVIANGVVYGDNLDYGPNTYTASAWTNQDTLIRNFPFPRFKGLVVADGKLFHWDGGYLAVLGN